MLLPCCCELRLLTVWTSKAARARHVKRGVKEVVKALKKNEKG